MSWDSHSLNKVVLSLDDWYSCPISLSKKNIILKVMFVYFHLKRVPDKADTVPLFKQIEMYQE